MSRLCWPLLCVLTGCYDFAGLTSGDGGHPSGDGGQPSGDGGHPTLSLALLAGVAGGPGSADGPLGESRFDGPAGLVVDYDHTIYVFDEVASTISTIDANGLVTRVAGIPYHPGDTGGPPGTSQLAAPQMGTLFNGTIYFTDLTNDDVHTLDVTTHVVGSAIAPMAGLGLLGITSNASTLYVTATKEPALYEDESDTLVVIAGTGTAGHDDAPGNMASFDAPAGVAWNMADSQLYIADSFNGEIRRYDPGTHQVTTISGTPSASPSACGQWCQPFGIVAAIDGTLYVSDLADNTLSHVTVMSPTTSVKTVVAGTSGQTGAADTSPGKFHGPAGLATKDSFILVADLLNHEVRAFDTYTSTLSTLAGTVAHNGNVDGVGAGAMLNQPRGLAATATHVYVADSGNGVIRSVDPTGQTALVNSLPHVTTCTGATAQPVPGGLAVTADGSTLFFLDSSQDAIVQLSLATTKTTTLCDGNAPLGELGRSGQPGQDLTSGLAIANDRLYVADLANDRILVFDYTASPVTVTTLAVDDSTIPAGCDNAPGFGAPVGVALDAAGATLYASLSHSCGVVGIDVATGAVVLTVGFAQGSDDGQTTSARFDNPGALAWADGTLYVSDLGNSTIRAVTAAGAVTTYVGTPGQMTNVPGALPARINRPAGLAYLPGTGLVIASTPENSLFVVR